jgi:hypothetical protein
LQTKERNKIANYAKKSSTTQKSHEKFKTTNITKSHENSKSSTLQNHMKNSKSPPTAKKFPHKTFRS